MSLALLFHYLMLNMFRMLVHPSSGICDLFVELFHGLYCYGFSLKIGHIGSVNFGCYNLQYVPGKNCIQQEEESFYQKIGLKFEEETSEVLRLEHSSVWC